MSELATLRGVLFRARALNADDGPQLQSLLEACTDYHELVLGHPPGPAEAQSVYYAGPEAGRDPENKMLFGILKPDEVELVGVLDAFRDYPEPGTWYVGLLLLAPRARGGGLGREVVEVFAAEARTRGARELQLNVVTQNQAGLRFWKDVGFDEVRRWRQRLGSLESTFVRMRRQL